MAAAEPAGEPRRVYTVANVNRGLARHVDRLPSIWVRGELSELSRNERWATVYLTLKDPDEGATLKATMSRLAFDRLEPAPGVGASVLVQGQASVYERTGELSLRASRIEPVGQGDLLARIELLRRTLAAEGLFDEARKRPLPFWPRLVGLVCGRDAAAPLDVIENARARFPAARFMLAETPVQGPAAVAGIVAALGGLDRHAEVDVIVLTRGGGSLEDLLAFSDEAVCRAIAACVTPVVSAVGHERDTPLCDLVADVRASTPTAAARLIVPDRAAELRNLDRLVSAVRRSGHRGLDDAARSLAALAQRPALRRPEHWVESRRLALAAARTRLDSSRARAVPDRGDALDALVGRLRAVAPEATLRRGYAIALDRNGRAVRDASALQRGDPLTLRLSRGRARATVDEVDHDGA